MHFLQFVHTYNARRKAFRRSSGQPASRPAVNYGQLCPVITGGKPGKDEFSDCGVIVGDDKFEIAFTNNKGETLETTTVER